MNKNGKRNKNLSIKKYNKLVDAYNQLKFKQGEKNDTRIYK